MMTDVGCSLSEEATKKLIAGVDTDGNGMIEFDEFIGIMAMRMLRNDGEGEIEQAFALFDDGNGKVPVNHVREILATMGSQRMTDAELDHMCSMLTPDANGCVSMEAFRSLACWQVPMPGAGARKPDAGAAGSSTG